MPLTFGDIGGLMVPYPKRGVPVQEPDPFAPILKFLQDEEEAKRKKKADEDEVRLREQQNRTTQRGQDLTFKAQQEQEAGADRRALLSAGTQRSVAEQQEAGRNARAQAKKEEAQKKETDKLYADFATARRTGDRLTVETYAQELKRRGYTVEEEEQKPAPELAEGGAPSVEIAKPQKQPTKKLGGIEAPAPRAGSAIQLGDIAVTAPPLARAPEKPYRKGYVIKQGDQVIYEDDGEEIRGWQQQRVEEVFGPLMANARDEGEMRAAQIGAGVAMGAIGTRPLKEAIDKGLASSEEALKRERFRRPKMTGGGGGGGPTKADKWDAQLEKEERQQKNADRTYATGLIKDEESQQKVKDLREAAGQGDSIASLIDSDSGLTQRRALRLVVRMTEKGAASDPDVRDAYTSSGLAAQAETLAQSLVGEGGLSAKQRADVKAFAEQYQKLMRNRLSVAAEAARHRVSTNEGLQDLTPEERERWGNNAYDTIAGTKTSGAAGKKNETAQEKYNRLMRRKKP